MRIERKQAVEMVKRRLPVLRDGIVVESVKQFPPEEQDDADYVALRRPDGRHTRAGLEHVIRSGGGVLHGGQVFTDVGELPDQETIDADIDRMAGELQHQHAMQVGETRRYQESVIGRDYARQAQAAPPGQPQFPAGAPAPEQLQPERAPRQDTGAPPNQAGQMSQADAAAKGEQERQKDQARNPRK